MNLASLVLDVLEVKVDGSSAEDLQFRRFTGARKLLLKVPEFIAKYKACS